MKSDDQIIEERIEGILRKVIQQQIETNDPPETNLTFHRLQNQGFTEDETFDLIGRVVSAQVIPMLLQNQSFDIKRYCQYLQKLPSPYKNK